MPSIRAPAKVLVSGANGYIAIWVVQNLLSQGYSVRGTVRSAEKGEDLRKLFEKYGDKHEVVVVEDITKVGPARTLWMDLPEYMRTGRCFRRGCKRG
jgi:nucleoside-diphosphate-sugar epimerase